MRRAPRHIARVRRWPDASAAPPSPTLDRLAATTDDLQRIVEATYRTRPDGEAVLRRLVAIAADDDLAARIVLQRATPMVISAAARFARYHAEDPAELALPAAWLAIRTYAWHTRRGPIAAAIASDAVYAAFRQQRRRRSTDDVLQPLSAFTRLPDPPPGENAIVELARVLREAAEAGVDEEDLDIVRHVARCDTVADVAADRKVTTRTIRNHRRLAVERIRAAVAA